MNISSFIEHLQKIKDEHGDIPVCVSQYISMYYKEPDIEIRECHILKTGPLDVADFDINQEYKDDKYEYTIPKEDVLEWNKNILWIGE